MSPKDQAAMLRAWLRAAKLSQRGCARLLQINDRDMRAYCAGHTRVPYVVMLAVYALHPNFKDGRAVLEWLAS